MKFGVNLINFGPGARPDALMQWSMLTEMLGYHFLMTSDHLAITPDVQERYPAPFYEPFTTLGWLAGVTRRLEIGTTVIVLPYRNPLELARMAANVDQLSGGRLLFGVGVGWAEQEFAVLDVPFHRRGALTDEYLAAIKTLWTHDVASFAGRYVTFQEVTPRHGQYVRHTRQSGGEEPAMRLCVGRSDTEMPGTRFASVLTGCATPGCRVCNSSPLPRARHCRRCARAFGCV